jgi:hypothetical protein
MAPAFRRSVGTGELVYPRMFWHIPTVVYVSHSPIKSFDTYYMLVVHGWWAVEWHKSSFGSDL